MVEQLVERIRQKDQRAMSQFYQMYVEELSSVCYRYVPSRSDAKDVLQNSFVKIFTMIQTFDYRGEEALRNWMKRVVASEAVNYLRERKKLKIAEQGAAIMQQSYDEESEPELISPDELHSLISKMPDGYRMVINLYVFEDYSHKQIAELLDITESTSATQLYSAKLWLARKIKEQTKRKQ